jgi:hypothetical protein
MAKQCADQAERAAEGFAEGAWVDPSRRKAAAHEAHGVQTFVVTSVPAATPIADMVEAMVPGGNPAELVVLTFRTAKLATVRKCLTPEASESEPT